MGSELATFVVRGAGKALPEGRLPNEELAAALGTTAESIEARTGIVERRVARDGESASGLGAIAGRQALDRAGLEPGRLDLVILSTYTPDHFLCPTSPTLAHRLGATGAGTFDVNAACSGGVTSLLAGASLLGTGAFRNVLVVASDLTTRYIREDDPKTRLVFGDGAAALLLARPGEGEGLLFRVRAAWMGSDGSGAEHFLVPDGGTGPARINGTPLAGVRTVVMNGRAIFRFGVEQGARVVETLLERAGREPRDVSWVIPHQANLRIIRAMEERTGIPAERWVTNLQRYGNTASPSVLLALVEMLEAGRVHPGDTGLLVAFGAGLTWSGLLVEIDRA